MSNSSGWDWWSIPLGIGSQKAQVAWTSCMIAGMFLYHILPSYHDNHTASQTRNKVLLTGFDRSKSSWDPGHSTPNCRGSSGSQSIDHPSIHSIRHKLVCSWNLASFHPTSWSCSAHPPAIDDRMLLFLGSLSTPWARISFEGTDLPRNGHSQAGNPIVFPRAARAPVSGLLSPFPQRGQVGCGAVSSQHNFTPACKSFLQLGSHSSLASTLQTFDGMVILSLLYFFDCFSFF